VVVTVSGAPILVYVLASIRIVAWLLIVPPFSTKAVPTVAKILLALALALAIAPQLAGRPLPTDAVGFLGTAVQEALIGTVMGFVAFLVFAAIQAAGDLIDLFGGFQIAQAFDPLSQNMNSINGKLFTMLGTMLMFASNMHLLVIGGLLRTFGTVPVGGSWKPSGSVTDVLTTAFSLFFTSAIQIALPLIAVLFLADLGLALLTRVAPQLQAINIMFPAKIGLTLLLVGLSFAVLPNAMMSMLEMLSKAMAALVAPS